MSYLLALLAQTTAPAKPASARPDVFLTQILPLVLMVVVFYWILMSGSRKERNRHAQMLANLKRNDRVQTIGGVLGTVVEVRDQEVVLKVDETNNVKLRFNRAAIKEVLAESSAGAAGTGGGAPPPK